MSTINTNVQSLNAQRNMAASTGSLSTSMQRLSSGLRVNTAKDDAAGLAISERMNAQVKGMNVAIRNANDGISLAQTAEGALGKVGDMLQRVRELAVQSTNATNSDSDRASLQAEAKQLRMEIQRVAEQTKFNGTNLLNGNFSDKAFQVGANQGETISIGNIANTQIAELGNWTSATQPAIATGAAPIGSGAVAEVPATPATSTATLTAGVGGDATDDFTVTFTAGGGQTVSITTVGATPDAATIGAAFAAQFGTDGQQAQNGFTLDLGGEASIEAAITAGSLSVVRADGDNFTVTEATSNGSGGAAAYTTDPSLDFSPSPSTDGVPATPATPGSFTALTAGAFTINGKDIVVGEAATAGERLTALASKINDTVDGVRASIENGALRLTSATDIEIGGSDPAVVTQQTGLTSGTQAATLGTARTGFADLDISTVDGANDAILAMDAALNSVNKARGELGAIQSRFENAISNLQVNSENLSSARGRIVDADFAKETANLSRAQILQQAGTAMIAQANQLPQGVLSLLR